MKNIVVGMISLLVGLVMTAGVFAASPLMARPWVYDPDHTGISQAAWMAHQGLPDAGGSNHALYLTKMGTTATNAASGATVSFAGRLTELGFDYRNDGHCGAGAPRFNVYTSDGYYFFGCTYGVHTPVNADWTRVRFTDADAVPAGSTPAWPGFGNVTVTGIEVVFDEGTDQGQGFVYLDNVDVNGTLIGKPGNAR